MLPPCPRRLRALFRRNKLVRPTSGLARGFVQANLVVLKKDLAFDFLLFCIRNPKPCPVLDVTEPGSPVPGWRRLRPTCGRIFPSTASIGAGNWWRNDRHPKPLGGGSGRFSPRVQLHL